MAIRKQKKTYHKSNTHGKNAQSNSKQDKTSEQSKGGSDPASTSKESSETEVPDGTKSNDVEWYMKIPELMESASNIPYSTPYGNSFDQLPIQDVYSALTKAVVRCASNGYTWRFVEPGIMMVYIKPSLGGADSAEDAVNIAAHLLYSDVRKVNSGRRNYDQNDLMMYILTVSELIGAVMWAKRLYNAAFVQSQRNFYVNNLLEIFGGSPTLVRDLAQLRSTINLFIAKISTLVVPANIELFKRRAFLYETIYTENESGSIMDQMYAFSPICFMKFQYDSSHAGCLLPYSGPNNDLRSNITLSDIQTIFDSLLENIIGNSDFAIMAGDILKYAESNVLAIAPQEAEGVIVPIYDYAVLSQIHNADIINRLIIPGAAITDLNVTTSNIQKTYAVPDSITDPSQVKSIEYGGIYQDATGLIRSREACTITISDGSVSISNALLTKANRAIFSPKGDTSPEYTIEATRLKVVMGNEFFPDDTTSYPKFSCCTLRTGTDIVVGIAGYTRAITTETNSGWGYALRADPFITGNYISSIYGNFSTVSGSMAFEYLLRQINTALHSKWNPYSFLLLYSQSSAGNVTTVESPYMIPLTDGDVVSVQTQDVIKRLHDVSWLSLCAATSRTLLN